MSKLLTTINKFKGFFIGFVSSVFSGIAFVSAQSDAGQMQGVYGMFIVKQQPTLWTVFKEMWLPVSLIIVLVIGVGVFVIKILRRRAAKNKNKINLSGKL